MKIGKDYIGVGVGAFILNEKMNYYCIKELCLLKKIIGVFLVED